MLLNNRARMRRNNLYFLGGRLGGDLIIIIISLSLVIDLLTTIENRQRRLRRKGRRIGIIHFRRLVILSNKSLSNIAIISYDGGFVIIAIFIDRLIVGIKGSGGSINAIDKLKSIARQVRVDRHNSTLIVFLLLVFNN